MNSLELLLSILFIVVIYVIVVNKIPSNSVMTVTVFLFVLLWIIFDNMNVWDSHNSVNILDTIFPKKNKPVSNYHMYMNPTSSTIPIRPNNINNPASSAIPTRPNNTNNPTDENNLTTSDIKKKVDDANKQAKEEAPRHLTYSENNYKYNLLNELGSLGDNMLAQKQKQRSNMNRVAMDNFSRMQTKYSNINYFAQELKDAASSRWWDNEDYEGEF